MKTTMTLSQSLGINPFDVLDRDIDDVILIINFYLAMGKEEPSQKTNVETKQPHSNDGFWDM